MGRPVGAYLQAIDGRFEDLLGSCEILLALRCIDAPILWQLKATQYPESNVNYGQTFDQWSAALELANTMVPLNGPSNMATNRIQRYPESKVTVGANPT